MSIFDRFRRKPVPRQDQWESVNLGIGNARDKWSDVRLSQSCDLAPELLRELYRQNSLAARIVDVIPQEMLREGYETKGLDEEDIPNALRVDHVFQAAMSWARLYGGAGIIVGANDGRAPWLPLREESVSSVDYLTPVDCRRLIPLQFQTDLFAPGYGLPTHYEVINTFSMSTGPVVVHASRVIRFEGDAADFETERQRRGWPLSVLQRCYMSIRDLGFSHQIALQLLGDNAQGVFRLTGLYDMIASGESENLQTRMGQVDQVRSANRSLLLDKENEDFQRVATPLQGLAELLNAMFAKLSADTGIPQTVLAGRSPAGMNATGASDTQGWHALLRGRQTRDLQPALTLLMRLLARAAGKPVEGVKVTMRPLGTPTAAEQAVIDKTNADRDNIYITAGVWTSEEVAIQRAKGNTTTVATEIDVDARKAAVEAAVELSLDPEAQAALMAPKDPNAQANEQGSGSSGAATPGPGKPAADQEG